MSDRGGNFSGPKTVRTFAPISWLAEDETSGTNDPNAIAAGKRRPRTPAQTCAWCCRRRSRRWATGQGAFVFYTNYETAPKGAKDHRLGQWRLPWMPLEIAPPSDPRARHRPTARKVEKPECLYASRWLKSRLGAWASRNQSQPLSRRARWWRRWPKVNERSTAEPGPPAHSGRVSASTRSRSNFGQMCAFRNAWPFFGWRRQKPAGRVGGKKGSIP